MRAIDTNVLVRLIVRDDEAQAAAADKFVSAGAWVSQLALAEAVWVLTSVYDLRPATIAHSIDLLLKHRDLTIQDSDVVEAALAGFRKMPSVDFSDCLLLEQARKAGHTPLGTFDRRLAKLHGTQKI